MSIHKIQYVAGKSRTLKGAEILRARTEAILNAIGTGQTARVNRVANGSGKYGYRVNVTAEVTK